MLVRIDRFDRSTWLVQTIASLGLPVITLLCVQITLPGEYRAAVPLNFRRIRAHGPHKKTKGTRPCYVHFFAAIAF